MKWTLIILLTACTNIQYQSERNQSKHSVTVLTAAVDGLNIRPDDGRYFADKLSEYLINDSTTVTDRAKITAFEISFDVMGRYALSPAEFKKMTANFPTDYFIFSQCKELSRGDRVEVQVRLVDAQFNTQAIESAIVPVSDMTSALNEAAKRLARRI